MGNTSPFLPQKQSQNKRDASSAILGDDVIQTLMSSIFIYSQWFSLVSVDRASVHLLFSFQEADVMQEMIQAAIKNSPNC